jgi:tungstate transport system substrate-binding protein
MKRNRLMAMALIAFSILFYGSAVAGDTLMMATTTSTDNTGLLDYLAPEFTRDTGVSLKWTAVGTGKALKLGKNCDVDVLMVHAPEAEKEFVAAGYGLDRRKVMYNDFVIIGPKADPAGIKGLDVKSALKKIAAEKAFFISRGDNSGTNKKETKLWKLTGLTPPEKQNWYVQSGQGMLSTINIAAERGGYTLTDRGTYIKYEASQRGKSPFAVMVEGSPELFNQYGVIIINKQRCPKVRSDLARRFSDWITSARAQKLIADFKLLGKPLFIPDAGAK